MVEVGVEVEVVVQMVLVHRTNPALDSESQAEQRSVGPQQLRKAVASSEPAASGARVSMDS